jgi:hypothetical protein
MDAPTNIMINYSVPRPGGEPLEEGHRLQLEKSRMTEAMPGLPDSASAVSRACRKISNMPRTPASLPYAKAYL